MFHWKAFLFFFFAIAAEHVSDEKVTDRWENGSGGGKIRLQMRFPLLMQPENEQNETKGSDESIWKDTESERERKTHSEPAAMSRYEVLAVSTPTGMTMLMTFCAGSLLSYWVQSTAIQNTEACQPQHSLHTSKCIHKACKEMERKTVKEFDNQQHTRQNRAIQTWLGHIYGNYTQIVYILRNPGSFQLVL